MGNFSKDFNNINFEMEKVKAQQNTFSDIIEDYCSSHGTEKKAGTNYLGRLKQECDILMLQKQLQTSVERGLTDTQAENNMHIYGENRFLRRKTKTFWQLFLQVLCDDTLIILIIAAIVSIIVEFFFGEDRSRFWVDGVSILFAVLICSIVGSISNYQKEKQFQELDEMTELTYNYDVIRGGERRELHRSDIVTGDMILISNGMQIPADCILLKAVDVIVDESSITGQSVELLKNTLQRCNPNGLEDSPLMISGSTVITGEGVMMAVVVGRNSHNGKNFQMIFSKQDEEQQTPLQAKLNDMAEKIGYLGLIAGIAIIVVLIIRLILGDIIEDGFNLGRDLPKIINYFIIGIAVLVAAIPEGLPLAVTITLAFSMKQMHEQKILVRKLVSCETMGSSHYICTDKTGTITSNEMCVRRVVNGPQIGRNNNQYIKMLTKAVCLNSTAIIQPYQKGSQTELALLHFVKKQYGVNPKQFRERHEKDLFKRLPFNSMRKRITTGVTIDGRNILFSSGASEKILQCCSRIMNPFTGEVRSIQNDMNNLRSQINSLSNEGMRVVGVAFKDLHGSQMRQSSSSVMGSQKRGEIEEVQKSDFILLEFFGIEDPPRKQSKQSIQKAFKAGIKVIMITGDNSLTANKIAKQVGIIQEGHKKSMQGVQFIQQLENAELLAYGQASTEDEKEESKQIRKLKKVQFNSEQDKRKYDRIIEGFAVMSRSRPEHKYILVDSLIKRGNVVAVTGDGSNDAPALKRASVGLAMGQTGTQAAKNASDIVVLDDRFDSIVRAIVWGRNVFTSIRKFLQFQLTINLLLIFITLLSSAIIRQSLFTPVQLLWFNLIMDSLAALALAAEPPNEEQMLKQPPNSDEESLLTPTMVKHIIGQSIWHLAAVMIVLFTGFQYIPEFADSVDDKIGSDLQAKYFQGEPQGTIQDGRMYTISGEDNYKKYFDKYGIYSRHFTLLFNIVVFLQIFNFFCCRKIKDEKNLLLGVCSSKLFWFIILGIIIIQFLIVQFSSIFFGLYENGLHIMHWLISVGIGFTTAIVSMALRFLCCGKPPSEKEQDEDEEHQ